MKDFVKGLAGFMLKVVAVLAVVYGVVQLAVMAGPLKVLAAVYLVLGFMIAWETRVQSGHRLWFLVIPFWVPVLVWGFSRRSKGLKESVVDEAVDKVESEK